MKYDSIIFDLDGTLWDTTEVISRVWAKILEQYSDISVDITPERLKKLFGKPIDQIGIELFTTVDKKRAVELITECCEKQNPYLAKEGGILYPNVEETLKALSEKYKLFIVSNCEDGYIETFYEAHKLEKYFIDDECPGRTKLYKADNIKLIVERNQLQHPVYVGDTLGDANATKEAGVPFIYARYGFGTVTEYDHVIDSFQDLINIL